MAYDKPNNLDSHYIEVSSYPKGGSFLDICIANNRLHFHNLTAQKKLKSFKYDSDHRIVSIKISLKTREHFEIDENNPDIKCNYNKADWPKFKAHLNNNNIDIPNDRDLTINEIDKYIEQLNTNIINAIDQATEHANNYNSSDRYITPQIKKLKKEKSQLISKINKQE